MTAPLKHLMDFKCPPELIIPSLIEMGKNAENWVALKESLVHLAHELYFNASNENIISAYITPTLRNLGLVKGRGPNLELTSDGAAIRRAYEQGGEVNARKQLASLLYTLDDKNGKIVKHLATMQVNAELGETKMQLVEWLVNLGFDKKTLAGSRLNTWLSMLVYAGLIRKKDVIYYCDTSQLEAIKGAEVIPNSAEFEYALEQCYRGLLYKSGGSSYVPIDSLRDCVANKMKLWAPSFDSLLEKLLANPKDHRILLAAPLEYREGGVWIKNKYYYLLAIFNK